MKIALKFVISSSNRGDCTAKKHISVVFAKPYVLTASYSYNDIDLDLHCQHLDNINIVFPFSG